MTKCFVVAGLLLLAATSLCAAQNYDKNKQTASPCAHGFSDQAVLFVYESRNNGPPSYPTGEDRAFVLLPCHGSVALPQMGPVRLADLPEGKDVWVLNVATSGGFAGQGEGNVTVFSGGNIECSPLAAPCRKSLPPQLFSSLEQAVREAKPEKWGGTIQSACSDCYQTALVLRRRAPGEAEQVYIAYWDDATARDAPADARRIYEIVMKFAPAGK